MNEMVKTLDWVAEDLLPGDVDDNKLDESDATVDELNALLNGELRVI